MALRESISIICSPIYLCAHTPASPPLHEFKRSSRPIDTTPPPPSTSTRNFTLGK